ncbi:uncharacterized protein TNCV_930591 [Trichonephila clavipes]|uniref:Mos1 transposase HTH domain-containing protein n=1 Tax=Trichonephila clavipes TaxID=2585209 RepID=A0A8X6W263_TRICX|nr:uncharacterized protein TNCV_930591 [Trichonephila clavipes]
MTRSVAKSSRVAEHCIVDSHLLTYSDATRGLLVTDHVILNHGKVTWTTPELAPPSPNYHTTPTGVRFSSRLLRHKTSHSLTHSALDRFNVHRCPTRRVFSGTGIELVTRQATIRYLYHSATAATVGLGKSAKETHGILKEVYKNEAITSKSVYDWFKRFLKGWTNLENAA